MVHCKAITLNCTLYCIDKNGTVPVKSVDEFVPDEGIDASFLEEGREVKEKPAAKLDDKDSRYWTW